MVCNFQFSGCGFLAAPKTLVLPKNCICTSMFFVLMNTLSSTPSTEAIVANANYPIFRLIIPNNLMFPIWIFLTTKESIEFESLLFYVSQQLRWKSSFIHLKMWIITSFIMLMFFLFFLQMTVWLIRENQSDVGDISNVTDVELDLFVIAVRGDLSQCPAIWNGITLTWRWQFN